MAIDGIGRGSRPPKVDGGPSSVSGPQTEKFEVASAGVDGASGVELLEQVQRGEVTLDAYLDVRAEHAVSHLEGALTPEQLEFVKRELREQLESDPVLIELVHRTTGQTPSST